MKAKKQDSTLRYSYLSLNSLDGEAITEPTAAEKANVLNENFRSVFTTEKLDNFPSSLILLIHLCRL